MKKTVYVLIGFAFCITIPVLAENYRTNNAHLPYANDRQLLMSSVQR